MPSYNYWIHRGFSFYCGITMTMGSRISQLPFQVPPTSSIHPASDYRYCNPSRSAWFDVAQSANLLWLGLTTAEDSTSRLTSLASTVTGSAHRSIVPSMRGVHQDSPFIVRSQKRVKHRSNRRLCFVRVEALLGHPQGSDRLAGDSTQRFRHFRHRQVVTADRDILV